MSQTTIQGNVTTGRDFIGRDMVVNNQITYQDVRPAPIEPAIRDAAITKLAELPLDTIPEVVSSLPTGSRMPLSANPLFVGREEELRTLAGWLKGGATVAIGQATGGQMVATTGMGGLGKTQLAAAFVHHYGQYFQGGVFWLTMADPASISVQVAECGENIPEIRVNYPRLEDYQKLEVTTQVDLVQEAWHSDLPRLLVFDNCEESEILTQWRPSFGACHVLVTSRRGQFDAALGVRALPLQTLPRAQSIELLAKFPATLNTAPYTAEELAELNAIASELGDLPLALHLAGSFLARYRRAITPATYLEQLQTLDSLEHRSLQSQEVSPTAHDQHVARTFALSYEQLTMNGMGDDATDALARRLLAQIACFAPGELIPRDLLLLTMVDESEDDALDAALQVEDALHRLMALGLVEVETAGQVILHRLLALFVQAIDRERYAAAGRVVDAALLSEANRLNNRGIPQPLLVWQIHLRSITETALPRADETAADLCNTLAFHLQMIGAYVAAKPYYEQALAIYEAVLGDQHPDTALSLNNLGALLDSMGELAAAKPYYEQALAIRLAVLGDQHPDTASSLNNLGFLLQAMGELAAAKPYFEQALAINEAVLGDQHPDTASSLNNLGALLRAMGELAAAKPYYEQALAIRLAVLGDQHPDTASSLNNLGFLLQAMGELAAAKPYYEQALAINEAVLGDQHPDTARSLNNLGFLLRAMGELAAAKPYYEQALAIRLAVLGDQHPDTASSLNNLGFLLQAMGELAAAKPYYEQALAIRLAVLGDQHPDTALSLNNLGGLLDAMGELAAAKPYFEQALAIFENRLGASHTSTETVRSNLAQLTTQLQNDT